MVTIRVLQKNEKDYVKKVAALHKRSFPNFFLTQLGIPFLRILYKGYLDDEQSGIIVAEKNGRLAGFIAYSNDYPAFYRLLIKSKIIQFAFCSAMTVIRHPSFTRRLLAAFKKSDSVVKPERYVELASICVDPQIESRGIGSQMIDFLKTSVDFDHYSYINLETDADDNDRVNHFYLKNGFTLHRQYTTAEGRKMNEYCFRP